MSVYDSEEVERVASNFKLNSKVVGIERFGSGHINDTFRLRMEDGGVSYLLQRINHHIFPDVDGLMNNIDLVTTHLKSVLKNEVEDVDRYTLTIIPTNEGAKYLKAASGDYWRVFILLDGTKSYDIVETPKQAFSGGTAFGRFQKQLSTLDATQLIEILPNFHNIDFRLSNLRKAMADDKVGRLSEVVDLLSYIFEREERMRRIIVMAKNGDLPLRITHNDTKFNNVLLDQDDNVRCVIDLDTVMPGYIAYDFGDAIRTIINAAAEDEKDVNNVVLNVPLFQAYTEGYFSEAKDFLTEKEIESLWYGVLLLPYMQAVRFLTDYIEGDRYYKVHYADHNLVRTNTQLKLVKELEAHEEQLIDILHQSLVNQ
ncbi:phosphotransferase enzyme family protein [Sphingobacterium paucimobilis]|uniref:Aminoglycoside phosphotransferase domain-containing protein n=1 Tax=Sphingobacterium paucimobilis HER1398 TaxID=1346330 RepID=U2H7D9_9SPHI|nr:aminoglycoside phosphotransferase family protein [Sphingobacterium paucimobilis]ERJ57606.1 hypothetical protein M472_02380 [Sphingobacterium paucimobilis HER1398]